MENVEMKKLPEVVVIKMSELLTVLSTYVKLI